MCGTSSSLGREGPGEDGESNELNQISPCRFYICLLLIEERDILQVWNLLVRRSGWCREEHVFFSIDWVSNHPN